MAQRGHHMLQDDAVGDAAAVTAEGMGRSNVRLRGQQRGNLRPQGLKERYWQGGNETLR